MSHGLNGFSDIDNVLFLSALNPSPVEFKFFRQIGISPAQLKAARFQEAAYQATLRCSLRSPDVSRPVHIVVVDRATADYLHRLLPKSTVQKLDWLEGVSLPKKKVGRLKEFSGNAQKQQFYRFKKSAILDHTKLISSANGLIRQKVSGDCRYETYINDNIENVTNKFWGMQFKDITVRIADDVILFDSADVFIENLNQLHSEWIEFKEDRSLVSPAFFNPNKVESTTKGNGNVEFLRGIWLDNDGGGLMPDQFLDLFSDLRMAIFNTHRSTAEKIRYRVFIPTTTVFGIETHKIILHEMWSRFHSAGFEADRLEQCGVGKRWHGFDWATRRPSSLFYLPCQAADPTGNLLVDAKGERRKPLDPEEWIKAYGKAYFLSQQCGETAPISLLEDGTNDQPLVASAKEWWRSVAKIPGRGNDNFFKLGLRLHSAGLTGATLAQELTLEAIHARNPEDRRRQIPSILQSLEIYKPGMQSRHRAA